MPGRGTDPRALFTVLPGSLPLFSEVPRPLPPFLGHWSEPCREAVTPLPYSLRFPFPSLWYWSWSPDGRNTFSCLIKWKATLFSFHQVAGLLLNLPMIIRVILAISRTLQIMLIPLADERGRQGRALPSTGPICFVLMQFLGIFWPDNRLTPPTTIVIGGSLEAP